MTRTLEERYSAGARLLDGSPGAFDGAEIEELIDELISTRDFYKEENDISTYEAEESGRFASVLRDALGVVLRDLKASRMYKDAAEAHAADLMKQLADERRAHTADEARPS